MNKKLLLFLLGLSLLGVPLVSAKTPAPPLASDAAPIFNITKILSVTIDSSINPATYSYLQGEYARAQRESYQAVLIKLNTPGGLVSTTKDILTLMGESEIPTFVWITPEGASASSAGAILASAAHVLAMSAASNIGAATPVEMAKDIQGGDLRKKAINDLVALVQSLSESRGRNASLFGKMVADAASYGAQEALHSKLIDFIASSEAEFIQKANGALITIKGKKVQLATQASTLVSSYDMDLGQKLLNILANPNLSYVFFLIGAALIYLEFQSTGIIAGSLGVACLILAGIGFQVLPLNFGALGLLILAFIMFILETYFTSHGLLSLVGLGALVIGSLFLFRTDQAYISMSLSLILTAVMVIAAFVFASLYYVLRERAQQKIPASFNSLIGKEALVLSILSKDDNGAYVYQVKVAGEIWQAKSEQVFQVGEKCTIKGESKGLNLLI